MNATVRALRLAAIIVALSMVGRFACMPASAANIVAWGGNEDGQCNVPVGQDFVAISARYKHNLALRANGSIVAWGQNNHGQSNAPAGTDFVAVSAGFVHSLALRSDGSLAAWGYNVNGECAVPSGTGFAAIAAGQYHNVAIKSDGSLIAWGRNDDGQCDVPSGHGFVAVAAGADSSVAIRSDGSLAVWGRAMCEPMLVPGNACQPGPPGGLDFIAVATDGMPPMEYGLALKSDGSILAWGANSYGQCTVPIGSQFTAIAAGSSHASALKADGTLVAWGRNNFGQCDVPVGDKFIAVAAGANHCLALMKEARTGRPIADAGRDLLARANEEVVLDASNSSDDDGRIILYTWKRLPDDVIVYSGPDATCTTRALGRAEEVFELTVTDNDLFTASDIVVIINRLLYDLQHHE